MALGLTAAAAAAAAHAQQAAAAPNADMRSFTASVQGDARDNHAYQATLSLPLKQRGWVQLGGGQSRNNQDGAAHRPVLASVGVGYIGSGWQGSLQATHRSDGSAYRQSDGAAALDWQGELFSIGLDGTWRNARQEGTLTVPDGRGGTTPVPVAQTVKGGGLGLRGGVQWGERTRLYAGLMRYDYRVATRPNGSSAAPGGTVGNLLGDRTLLARALSTRASAVTRDESALSRSLLLGASYRLEPVALSAEYTGDRVLDTPGTVHNVVLKAAWALSPNWTLTPAIGRTRSASHGSVDLAALSLRHAW